MEGHCGRADLSLLVHGAIEDRRLFLGTVEAQVGNGQAGLSVCAREGYGTVDKRALGRVFRREREIRLSGSP